MANEIIRPSELPSRIDPVASEVVPSDNGATVGGVTWDDGVNSVVPPASQPESEAGVINTKRMTPLTTKQAIDAQVPPKISTALGALNLGSASQSNVEDFATAVQGAKADSAVQPGVLATVATSGEYSDLDNKPTLGSAAAADAGDFATSAQGSLADSALQPGVIGSTVQAHDDFLDALAGMTPGIPGDVIAFDSGGNPIATAAGAGDLIAANNLSDLDDVADARDNLGVTYATQLEAIEQDESLASNERVMTVLRTLQAVRASLKEHGVVSVKTMGALGTYDFTTFSGPDDTIAIQDAYAAVANEGTYGGDVLFPGGNYQVTGTVDIPQPGGATDSGRIGTRGYGPGTSTLAVNTPIALRMPPSPSAGWHRYGGVRGLRFRAVGGAKVNTGLYLNQAAFALVEECLFENLNVGVDNLDVLSSTFRNVIFRGLNVGFSAQRNTRSYPNALTFDDCRFLQCSTAGIRAFNNSSLVVTGGSVEGCGTEANVETFGIHLVNPGNEGSTGAVIRGVYFEGNMGGSDINVTSAGANGAVAHEISGNTFNRLYASAATRCIRIQGEAGFSLSAHGNGFKGFLGYSPSTARRVIQLSATDMSTITLDEGGNYYMYNDERPAYDSAIRRKAPDNTVSASGEVALDGTLSAGSIGIHSVSKLDPGVYQITFSGQDKSKRSSFVTMRQAGHANTANPSVDGSGRTVIQVGTYIGGVLADADFSIMSVGGW